MGRHVFKLPDLGEGTVAAEIIGWRVKPGDLVTEDDIIVEVMTDKAAVEVPAPVSGKVIATTGNPGDSVPVGSELIVFETENRTPGEAAVNGTDSEQPTQSSADATVARCSEASQPNSAGRVATSPAIRRRAHEAGVDLASVRGSGPNGRIVRADLEAILSRHCLTGPGVVRAELTAGRASDHATCDARPSGQPQLAGDTEEIKVIGLRRLIAQKMSAAKRNIPHFAYVEEIDVTELEALRRHLNERLDKGAAALTYLPFIVLALTRVLRDFPQCNATYDDDRGVIVRYRTVHVGIATQTADGLKVPVVRDAQTLDLWKLAAQMGRVTEAARSNTARREELTGSTITVTSLGKLGGIASTPIINAPEVSIIGINRALERPVVLNGAVAVRRMMNLSSSFDHRFVDGYDAAAMIQALKARIEHPATIFIGA